MGSSRKYLLVCLMLVLSALLVFAQDNETNETLPQNESIELPENVTLPEEPLNETPPAPAEEPVLNITNKTEPKQEPPKVEEEPLIIVDFDIINITPDSAELGDVTLEINLINAGTVRVINLVPKVIARGFSTYDYTGLKSLNRNQTGKMLVSGRFEEPGDIILTITISSSSADKVFYDKIRIERPKSEVQEEQKKEEERKRQEELVKQQEELKKAQLANLTAQYNELKVKYAQLEREYFEKKDSYQVSDVKIDAVKQYIMNTQAALTTDDVEKARVSILQAETEYEDQKARLDSAEKTPFLKKLRENVVLISAIAGGFITIVSFYELVKKKKEGLVNVVKDTKVGFPMAQDKKPARAAGKKPGKKR